MSDFEIVHVGIMRKDNIPKLIKLKIIKNQDGVAPWPEIMSYEGSRYEFVKLSGMTRAIYKDIDYNEDVETQEFKTREEFLNWENTELKSLLKKARETLSSMGINVERIEGIDNSEPPRKA